MPWFGLAQLLRSLLLPQMKPQHACRAETQDITNHPSMLATNVRLQPTCNTCCMTFQYWNLTTTQTCIYIFSETCQRCLYISSVSMMAAPCSRPPHTRELWVPALRAANGSSCRDTTSMQPKRASCSSTLPKHTNK